MSTLLSVVSVKVRAAPSGELLIMAPPVLRFAAVEVDGQSVGKLPQKQRLPLEAGTHQVAIQQGRWRLSAEVDVHAGQRAIVRWPRPGAGKVSYPPTMALLVEPPDAAPELRRAAADSIHRGHFEVLGDAGIATETVVQAACGETLSCLEEQAQVHGLRHVLAVQASAAPDGYTLSARLFDAETGDLAAKLDARCPDCSIAQAGAKLNALCSDVIKKGTTRKLGLLELTSQPDGAEVLVDGRRVGTTPYRRPAAPGEHEVVVHKTGYLDYQNVVDVVADRGSALDAVLQLDTPPPSKKPAPPPPVPPRTLSRRQ